MRMPTLETQRLRIRELTSADLAAVHALLDASDPRALEARRRWLEWSALNYEQLAELKQPPYGDRAVELRDTAEFVGLCGLVPCLGPYGPLLGEPDSLALCPKLGCTGRFRPSTVVAATRRRRAARWWRTRSSGCGCGG